MQGTGSGRDPGVVNGRRRLGVALLAAALALGPAAAARAATLPFVGSILVEIGSIAIPAVLGSGVALVNGSGAGAHVSALALAGGTFATSGALFPVTDPVAAPIEGVILTAANGAGAFAGLSGGMGGGAMLLGGQAKVCLFGACTGSALANLVVPLSADGTRGIGLGGGGITVKAAVNITVVGAPWTQGTVARGTATRMGFGHGPASASSTTAQPGGVVQLVTPIFISTSIGSLAVLPAFATLRVEFIPEPATLLLLGAGVLGLAALGELRRRR